MILHTDSEYIDLTFVLHAAFGVVRRRHLTADSKIYQPNITTEEMT